MKVVLNPGFIIILFGVIPNTEMKLSVVDVALIRIKLKESVELASNEEEWPSTTTRKNFVSSSTILDTETRISDAVIVPCVGADPNKENSAANGGGGDNGDDDVKLLILGGNSEMEMCSNVDTTCEDC